MDSFTIKDLENLSGVKAHTIRIWEQRYGFLKPRRTSTNIRYYSNEELKTILNISLLTKYGYKISHIDRMSPDQVKERITALDDAQAQKERLVNELVQYMIDTDMEAFDKALRNHIMSKGIEKTVTQLIFSFLEKIGVLWQTGHINPAQEHLVTNIIRQKLIAAIENCTGATRKKVSAMLFLPEGEHHELGILYICYLLRSRGIPVIYLGANVPVKDALYIAKLKKPGFIFCHLTATAPSFNFSRFLKDLQHELAGSQVILSGSLARAYAKKTPEGIALKKSLTEISELITAIS